MKPDPLLQNADWQTSERDGNSAALAGRLRWLRLQRGWNMDRVAGAAGISRTTLFHLERNEIRRPRASTLFKLAQVFDVPVESLRREGEEGRFRISDFGSEMDQERNQIRNPKSEIPNPSDVRRAFDRATNPVVAQVASERPELFAGWTIDEWDELYSQFATGGALREEGVAITATRINRDRESLYRLRVVLQTHLSDVAAGMIDTLYKLVSVDSVDDAGQGASGDDVPLES